MKLNLDIVIGSKSHEIDMQFGLESLKGASDVIGVIAESILRKRVPDRRTHKSDARTKLKQSFKGSYGQRFYIEILEKDLQSRFRKIGRDVFLEVLNYYITDALYLEQGELSSDAEALVEELSDISEKLEVRLKEPLIDMHKIATYFGYPLTVRYKKRGELKPREIIKLNKNTAKNITEATISKNEIFLDVVVVRFHSITGNGRFYIKELDEIRSFGFASEIKSVRYQMSSSISENLHENNKIQDLENGKAVNLRLKEISLPTGKVIKYLITGINKV